MVKRFLCGTDQIFTYYLENLELQMISVVLYINIRRAMEVFPLDFSIVWLKGTWDVPKAGSCYVYLFAAKEACSLGLRQRWLLSPNSRSTKKTLRWWHGHGSLELDQDIDHAKYNEKNLTPIKKQNWDFGWRRFWKKKVKYLSSNDFYLHCFPLSWHSSTLVSMEKYYTDLMACV